MAEEWVIQEIPDEATPFLLYNGVLVARLYGGFPSSTALRLLNRVDDRDVKGTD